MRKKATTIQTVTALEILDSRGRPTVQARVELSDGTWARANAPSGVSTGQHEALELRDHEERYGGFGVRKAVANVHGEIADAIRGKDAREQADIDAVIIALDGTPNKARLGANAILTVSLAVARAAARSQHQPLYAYLRDLSKTSGPIRLPYPMMNILNGGKHADNRLSVQEYLIVPRVPSFAERMRLGSELYRALGQYLTEHGHSTLVGDEGGYAPRLRSNTEGFAIIHEILAAKGVSRAEVGLACDVASSEFYSPQLKQYALSPEERVLSSEEMIAMLRRWDTQYDLLSIEDGLAEDDWDGWRQLTHEMRKGVLLVGDDLFVTNAGRLQHGIDQKVANAILIKLNQIGTLTETFATIRRAQQHGYAVVISHRSGETEDPFIADLCVGVGAEYLKAGSLARSERTAKYNRLLAIEQEIARA